MASCQSQSHGHLLSRPRLHVCCYGRLRHYSDRQLLRLPHIRPGVRHLLPRSRLSIDSCIASRSWECVWSRCLLRCNSQRLPIWNFRSVRRAPRVSPYVDGIDLHHLLRAEHCVLTVGEVLCGLPWGVFASIAPAYASEVLPLSLRVYLTNYTSMICPERQQSSSFILIFSVLRHRPTHRCLRPRWLSRHHK